MVLRSMATEMAPTPTGAGVLADGTGARDATATSPPNVPPTRLLPTSRTSAPGFPIALVITRGRPTTAPGCRPGASPPLRAAWAGHGHHADVQLGPGVRGSESIA